MARTFFTQNLMNIDWILFELSRNVYRKIFGPSESGHLCFDWFEIYRLCLYCYVLFAHIISLRLINNFLSNKRLTICNEKLFGQIGSVHFLFEITGYLTIIKDLLKTKFHRSINFWNFWWKFGGEKGRHIL